MTQRTLWKISTVGIFLTASAISAKVNNPNIQLVYDPQQTVAEATVTTPVSVRQHAIRIRVVDGRSKDDVSWIGSRTNDDDLLFQLKATNEVVPFVEKIFIHDAQEWGFKIEDDSDLVLAAELLMFQVTERDQAVGATYRAEVSLAAQLKNRLGNLLWSGTAFGDATRYGRKFSNDNCNEVLSDAMRESFAALLNQQGLQHAWVGKSRPIDSSHTSSASTESVSPTELLEELQKLLDQGFSHDTLTDYVNQKSLSHPMTAEDLTRWKSAGVPEEVIRTAMNRPVR